MMYESLETTLTSTQMRLKTIETLKAPEILENTLKRIKSRRTLSVAANSTNSDIKFPRCKTEYKIDKNSKNINSTNNNVKLKRSSSTKSFSNISLSRDVSCGKIYARNHNNMRIFDTMPKSAMNPLHIVNQEEVKKKFLESKIPPIMQFKGNERVIQDILIKHSKPKYKDFFKAKHILELMKSKYSTNPNIFFEENFGCRISSKECISLIGDYLTDNKIGGEISINFAPGLTCSGRIISKNWRKTRPEARTFDVWINDDPENQFLRQYGIVCLCDHEIGTHYYRAYNEGFQAWFSDRKKFGLRSLNSREVLKTEEGLAALHTVMNCHLKYLYLPALLYYLVCMGHRMTFEQLYNHMEKYISIPEERWKYVTRVKRGISNPHEFGCYSRDQVYFEGAVEILEKLEEIDFMTLMSGKLCVDEVCRVKRVARTECIKIPKFLYDIKLYKERLRHIGIVNGIIRAPSRLDDRIRISKENLFYSSMMYSENEKRQRLNTPEIERFIDREAYCADNNKTPIPSLYLSSTSTTASNLCIIL